MSILTEEEKTVLLALSELDAATLEGLAVKTGIEAGRLKAILQELVHKRLLEEIDQQDNHN